MKRADIIYTIEQANEYEFLLKKWKEKIFDENKERAKLAEELYERQFKKYNDFLQEEL